MGVLGGFLDSRNGFLDVSVDSVIRAASKTYDDDSCYLPVADVEKKVERLVFREGQRFNRTKGSFLIDSMKMCVPLSEQSQLVTLGHAARCLRLLQGARFDLHCEGQGFGSEGSGTK